MRPAARTSEGSPGVPQGIVEQNARPRWDTHLHGLRKFKRLTLFLGQVLVQAVGLRHDRQVALAGLGHVGEEIADLQLQQRNARP